MVKLSDDELEFLTGSREPEAARALWHDRLRLLTVTRGGAGSAWLTADARGDVPSFPVKALDTTGAGDAFMAGLLAGALAVQIALGIATIMTGVELWIGVAHQATAALLLAAVLLTAHRLGERAA